MMSRIMWSSVLLHLPEFRRLPFETFQPLIDLRDETLRKLSMQFQLLLGNFSIEFERTKHIFYLVGFRMKLHFYYRIRFYCTQNERATITANSFLNGIISLQQYIPHPEVLLNLMQNGILLRRFHRNQIWHISTQTGILIRLF